METYTTYFNVIHTVHLLVHHLITANRQQDNWSEGRTPIMDGPVVGTHLLGWTLCRQITSHIFLGTNPQLPQRGDDVTAAGSIEMHTSDSADVTTQAYCKVHLTSW